MKFELKFDGVRLGVTRITLHLLRLNSIHQSDSHFSELSSCNCQQSLSDFIAR